MVISKNIIETKNLFKKFNDFIAVDNVSFNVKEGEVFAFLGPNGAGKTTTIKMLTTSEAGARRGRVAKVGGAGGDEGGDEGGGGACSARSAQCQRR